MGILKKLLLNFNSFQSPQFFRFNGEPQFTNILGGIFTIFIRGLLLTLLLVKLIDVFNRTNVIASSYTQNQITIKNTTMSPHDTNSPFILAAQVYIVSSNMTLAQLEYQVYGWTTNSSGHTTYLRRCTAEHWAAAPGFYDMVIESIQPNKSLLLCLPLGFQHQMDHTQDSILEISLGMYCGGPCSSANLTELLVRPILYNRLINPQKNKEYISDFLDKRRYYGINSKNNQYDVALTYFISKYSIQTDQSLMPWSSLREQNGIFIPRQPGLSYHPNQYSSYSILRMTYMLSNEAFFYERRYEKVFDAVSLIGGLIPIFTILFIWLYYYALAHFEMTFIKKLHSDQKAKQYGVFFFFGKLLYAFLSFFNVDMKNWQKTTEYHKMHKIVNNHLLDVIYLYKRIQFLERALEVLLEDHQKKVIHLMRNKTFDEAEKNYGLYQMKNNLAKFVVKRKKQKEKRQEQFKGNQIILEPVIEPKVEPTPQPLQMNPIQSLDTNKPLHKVKEFQGDLNEGQLYSSQNIPNSSDKDHKSSEQENKNEVFDFQEDSQYNQQMEHEEINTLRQAFGCYERLKKEAEDCNSQYYSIISKNIYKRLDDVDLQLLDQLQHLLKASEKSEILDKVMNSLAEKADSYSGGSDRGKGSLMGPMRTSLDRQLYFSRASSRGPKLLGQRIKSPTKQHKKE